jgi:hypothetical protein
MIVTELVRKPPLLMESKAVCEHEDITVLWNQGAQTDGEVVASRSDIISKNKTDKICLLIDVAIQSDRNVIQ